MDTITVAHISDLHFCTKALQQKLSRFSSALQRKLPIDLEIGFHDEDVAKALRNFVQQTDPTVLLITGDITTFGDRESFDLAYNWIDSLLRRATGQRSRTCVVVPGNHDVLQGQFAHLLRKNLATLPWYVRSGFKKWLGEAYKLFEELTDGAKINVAAEIFNNFNDFEQKPGITSKMLQLEFHHGQKLIIHPFRSVSTNPIWMNLGQSVRQEIGKLNTDVAGDEFHRSGELHLLALHHNPISSANVAESAHVHAYNSMPAGVQLLRTVQQTGIDLVLHGHQHQKAIALFDFDLERAGHAYAVGVPSSTARTNAGCNLLVVQNVNQVQLESFEYKEERDRFESVERRTLCLERHRPVEQKTLTVRYEIKGYISEDSDGNEGAMWDDILVPGSDLIYISGRKLRFVTDEYLSGLKVLLDHFNETTKRRTCLRLLVSNPALLRKLAKPWSESTDTRESGSIHYGEGDTKWIWGRKEDLEQLASDAERSLERLSGFIEGLDIEQQYRIDVRITHSLLPFAATVRDANKNWGKMVVRLLPVGAIGDLSNPVLKLHRRTDKALYDHYFTHLKYLIARGTSVLGRWNQGEDDLRLDGLPNPNLSK